jgi:hypothetical protein
MLVFLWIFWAVGNVVFWFGSIRDHNTSIQQTPFGLSEADLFKINRDKYGYFAPRKFWIAHLLYWAIFTVITLVFYYFTDTEEKWLILLFFSMLFLYPAGIVSLYTAYNNDRKAKKSRENVQIPLLEQLSQITPYSYDAVNSVFAAHQTQNLYWLRTTGGRTRAQPFPWLYMDGATGEVFLEKFYPAIWEISQRGKAQWFADTKMRQLT